MDTNIGTKKSYYSAVLDIAQQHMELQQYLYKLHAGQFWSSWGGVRGTSYLPQGLGGSLSFPSLSSPCPHLGLPIASFKNRLIHIGCQM